jgi:hypothetical protein
MIIDTGRQQIRGPRFCLTYQCPDRLLRFPTFVGQIALADTVSNGHAYCGRSQPHRLQIRAWEGNPLVQTMAVDRHFDSGVGR